MPDNRRWNGSSSVGWWHLHPHYRPQHARRFRNNCRLLISSLHSGLLRPTPLPPLPPPPPPPRPVPLHPLYTCLQEHGFEHRHGAGGGTVGDEGPVCENRESGLCQFFRNGQLPCTGEGEAGSEVFSWRFSCKGPQRSPVKTATLLPIFISCDTSVSNFTDVTGGRVEVSAPGSSHLRPTVGECRPNSLCTWLWSSGWWTSTSCFRGSSWWTSWTISMRPGGGW